MPERKRGGRDTAKQEEPAAAARSFWSGTITFGLVSIPVDFYAAARSRQKSMKLVDREGHPLGRRYYAEGKDKPLANDDIVRGYPTEAGEMVVITDEEFDSAAPEESRDIELSRFVPFEQVPPLHFERPYFLTPAGRSAKAYTLLAQTMERADKAGIGRLVMRGHEYLVAIIAEGGVLRAETLRHADELRTPEAVGLPPPSKPAKKQVTALARQIDALAKPQLDLDELEDREAERLQAVSQEKYERQQDVVQLGSADDENEEEQAGGGKVVDLMQLLRKSLGARSNGQDKPARSSSPPPKAGAPKRKTAAPAPSAASDLAKETKAHLYELATELGIDGRSKMSKDELARAIGQSRAGKERRAG